MPAAAAIILLSLSIVLGSGKVWIEPPRAMKPSCNEEFEVRAGESKQVIETNELEDLPKSFLAARGDRARRVARYERYLARMSLFLSV